MTHASTLTSAVQVLMVQRWSNQPGTALYWAMKEGQVVYG